MDLELTVFADESGTHGHPSVCVVSGYLGTPNEWTTFNMAWRHACRLLPEGVSEFHATDFFYRRPNGERKDDSPYFDWSDDDDFRLLVELVHAVRESGLVSVGGAVDVIAFSEYSLGERKWMTGGFFENGAFVTDGAPERPYFVALQALIADAVRKAPADTTVHFAIDFSSDTASGAQKLYDDIIALLLRLGTGNKMGRLSFPMSHQEPGLQAADMKSNLWHALMTHKSALTTDRIGALAALCGPDPFHGLIDAVDMDDRLSRMSPRMRAQLRAYSD